MLLSVAGFSTTCLEVWLLDRLLVGGGGALDDRGGGMEAKLSEQDEEKELWVSSSFECKTPLSILTVSHEE